MTGLGMGRALAAVTILLLSGCQRQQSAAQLPFTQDAYVWQRQWNDSLRTAIREATPDVHTWRVLVGEVDGRGDLTSVHVDWEALRTSGKPIIGVVRTKSLSLGKVLGDWPVSGIEVDYDCATSQLGAYRLFLHELRQKKKADWTLSITALPSWMGSGDLAGVLGEVDEAVLQVHSVMNPQKGLFDRATAYSWAKRWAEMTPVPFRVALPTYWSRVSWNRDGRVTAIESEVSRYGMDEDESRELFIDPEAVSGLVNQLKQTPLRRCEGVAWFRLPTAQDERAWNMSIWRAVMAGRVSRPSVPVVRIKEAQPGVRDVYVANESEQDGRLPVEVSITAQGCAFADAMEPYEGERGLRGVQFRLKKGDVLKARQERMVGWVRCTGKEIATRVSVE